MSRKAKPQANANSNGYKFININLRAADERWLEENNLDVELPLMAVLTLVEEGYKFSLSVDSKNNSYVASLTDNNEQSDFFRCILTGRGSSPVTAWYSVAYKHFILAEGDWVYIASPGNDHTPRFG